MPKRIAFYEGRSYKVKSDRIEIPNFEQMERMAVLQWMLRNTYPRGYGKPNPLAGMGGILRVGGQ
ncbi:hypothetical protein [Pseudonocardia sp.]|uniref:hypothetical protein n=1 Tax=Pseudonocardia sp. TaxID=60912 RepID=UPI0026145A15|nr:hypothetical protein [Pseudonocardia sp.]MCW2721191.1 hypothetical protein [Pseudonocardia sp.]MDT7618209.1 hypothetical protein [Pseudonocardiales bacterium]